MSPAAAPAPPSPFSDSVNVNSVTFTGSGYAVTGGLLKLVGAGGVITTTQDATIGSVIGGTVGLTKAGNGVLTLTAANTYTGTTRITAGTLKFGVAGGGVLPLVHYTLDSGTLGAISPGTIIPDSSGNGINLTVRDSGASYVAGHFGQGISMPTGVYMYAPAVPALTSLNSWTDSIWINIPAANINNNQGLVTTTYPDGNGFETGYFAADHSIYIQVLNNQNNNWLGYGHIQLPAAQPRHLAHDHLHGHGDRTQPVRGWAVCGQSNEPVQRAGVELRANASVHECRFEPEHRLRPA